MALSRHLVAAHNRSVERAVLRFFCQFAASRSQSDVPSRLDAHPHRRSRAPDVSRRDGEARPEVHAQTRWMRRQGCMQNVLLRNGVFRAVGVSMLLALSVGGSAWSQGQPVSGTVTSATGGQKLWGVTVRVKGTQTQTVTNQQGRYALVAPADAVLTFAMIGFRGTEKPVGGQGTIDVTMEAAPTVLQEIVVTGYTTQRRQDITGAVASVNLQEANKATTTSVLQRMEGQVAGVTVNASGSPGSRPTVRLRGGGSVQNNDPRNMFHRAPGRGSVTNFPE